MIYKLVPSVEADNDVFDIACYLSEQREGLGFRFYECVEDSYQRIAENPLLKGLAPFRHAKAKNIRIALVKDFSNYLIFYQIVSNKVNILRVLHGARDYMNLFDGL